MDGYAKLATLMGAYPEVAIIRRFAALNAQNVLYLQAELVNLESRLRKFERQDQNSGDPIRVDYALDWFKLSNATDVSQSTDLRSETSARLPTIANMKANKESDEIHHGRRWTMFLQIREKLKEYSAAADDSLLVVRLNHIRN